MAIIKVKTNGVWQEVAGISEHTHTTNDITNFPSSLPANGGNADTLDGKHASDFATAAGLETLKTQVGNTTVSEQINTAVAGLATTTYVDQSIAAIPVERNSWDLVQDVTVDEEVGYLFYSEDSDGVELKTKNYTKAYLFIETVAQESASNGELQAFINVQYESQDNKPRASAGTAFIKTTSKQYWKAQFDIDNALCLFGLKGIASESWSDTVNSAPDSYKLFAGPHGGLYTNPGFVNNIKIQAPIGIPVGTKIKIWMR